MGYFLLKDSVNTSDLNEIGTIFSTGITLRLAGHNGVLIWYMIWMAIKHETYRGRVKVD